MSRQKVIVGILALSLALLVSGAYAVRKQVAATLNPEGTT